MADEKKQEDHISGNVDHGVGDVEDAVYKNDDEFEVFKKHVDGVDFRLVGWLRASVIFLKGSPFRGVSLVAGANPE
jgi:hypothetical protein